MTQINTYDPENWLLSTTRALKEYVESKFSDAFKIVMEFPGTEGVLMEMPLPETIIHFEIDTIEDRVLGFGDNIVNYNYDDTINPAQPTTNPQYGGIHVINFDVGVWATDRSGGTTYRAKAKQTLNLLFQGKPAQDALDAAVSTGDGKIEIINWTGGRFLTDNINDVDVYRMVDCSLDVRVFSRTPLAPVTAPPIDGLAQDENLDIDGVPIP